MRGFAILLGFWLAGEGIVYATGAPLPGQVVGMMLLLIALLRGWVKEAWVKDAADLLFTRMMLFFAPVIAGVMIYFPVIRAHWLPVAGAVLLGTLGVLAATGGAITVMTSRRRERARKEDYHVGA
ncbi:CidA/LrgA family protein [Paenibacillus methanolicus]|uniref:Holin-like protein n=1 Tax=Paenibacillus methanolicus TaxID=582686 RepID=A0A5S5C6K8_9BACL|nr:CidA/LrgA family protein [Paenibacillus methanolicus]TYP74799.1 holin-like protein [Paenibacillus methanolicus]